MMLQNIMGTPLLGWLVSSLIAGGVGRFFLVCHERYKREVRALFPDDVEFLCPTAETTSDQLHVFLSTAEESEEDIIVVTGMSAEDIEEQGGLPEDVLIYGKPIPFRELKGYIQAKLMHMQRRVRA